MLELMWKEKAKRAKKNQKGFTLVELIVVVAILGILAVIGITRFAGLTDNARTKADVATAASIASATQVHIAESDSKVNDFTWDKAGIETNLVDKNYLDEPKDPQSQGDSDTWSVEYTDSDKKVIVKAGTEQMYPAP